MASLNTTNRLRRCTTACAIVLALLMVGGKPKPAAKDAAPPGPELPSDLNSASLRVHAIDVIYELDLSPEQLKMLRTAADGAEDERMRTAASNDEKTDRGFCGFQ